MKDMERLILKNFIEVETKPASDYYQKQVCRTGNLRGWWGHQQGTGHY
jgi:hypothetical protein